jgi:hypothetical protein
MLLRYWDDAAGLLRRPEIISFERRDEAAIGVVQRFLDVRAVKKG